MDARDKTCWHSCILRTAARSRDIAEIIACVFAKHLGRCRNFQVIAREESACCDSTLERRIFHSANACATIQISRASQLRRNERGSCCCRYCGTSSPESCESPMFQHGEAGLDRFLPRTACSAHVIAKLVPRNWFSWPGQLDTSVYSKSWGLINARREFVANFKCKCRPGTRSDHRPRASLYDENVHVRDLESCT